MEPTRENLIRNLNIMLEEGHISAKCPAADPDDNFYYNTSPSEVWCELCHDFMGVKRESYHRNYITCPCYYYGRDNIEDALITILEEVS